MTTKSYDFIKYSGKVHNVTYKQFETSGKPLVFHDIASKRNPMVYILGNLVLPEPRWYTQFTDENSLRCEKYLSAKVQHFSDDIQKLSKNLMIDFSGDQPRAWHMWNAGELNTETLSILELFVPITKKWASILPETKQTKAKLLMINKYSRFFASGDPHKYEMLIRKHISDN